jgi:hypothetical protein
MRDFFRGVSSTRMNVIGCLSSFYVSRFVHLLVSKSVAESPAWSGNEILFEPFW